MEENTNKGLKDVQKCTEESEGMEREDRRNRKTEKKQVRKTRKDFKNTHIKAETKSKHRWKRGRSERKENLKERGEEK